MKELSGTATGVADAPIEACFHKLADLESYPQWYPDGIGRADVVERDADGRPTRVDTSLLISLGGGGMNFNFDVPLEVILDRPESIRFQRVADGRHDPEQLQVSWVLKALDPQRTELTAELRANLNVPPFLPVGRIAQDVASGFVQAAIAAL
jgi:hypothetical protein